MSPLRSSRFGAPDCHSGKTMPNQGAQDIHSGRRAFIIGNGPSLTVADLERLKGEVTFASEQNLSRLSSNGLATNLLFGLR